MFYAFYQKVIARRPNTVRENKQTEKSLLQLLSKRNKRILYVSSGKSGAVEGNCSCGCKNRMEIQNNRFQMQGPESKLTACKH